MNRPTRTRQAIDHKEEIDYANWRDFDAITSFLRLVVTKKGRRADARKHRYTTRKKARSR